LNSMKINMLQYAYEEFENIKGDNQNPLTEWRTVNTMSKRKKQQKDNQRSTKHCTENWRSSNTNPTKNFRCTQVLQRVSSSSTNSDTRCVTIVTKPVISHGHLCG
jgi:hypothetical protein